jgi:hypothetical protein
LEDAGDADHDSLPTLLPRRRSSWAADIEAEPPPLLNSDELSHPSEEVAHHLASGENTGTILPNTREQPPASREEASRPATGEDSVFPDTGEYSNLILAGTGEMTTSKGKDPIVNAAHAPSNPIDGPTIVSDEETDTDNHHAKTSPPKRRSSRIPKKCTMLTMLATALSIMGGRPLLSKTHQA